MSQFSKIDLGKVLGLILGAEKCLLNCTPGPEQALGLGKGRLGREEAPPLLAHIETVCVGLVVEAEEYPLCNMQHVSPDELMNQTPTEHGGTLLIV